MSCSGIRASKTADKGRTYTLPRDRDLTGYAVTVTIAEEEGDTPLLTLTGIATANGSIASATGNAITLLFKAADLQTLPNGTPISDPWVGMCEVRVTSPTGLVSLIERTAFILDKGI